MLIYRDRHLIFANADHERAGFCFQRYADNGAPAITVSHDQDGLVLKGHAGRCLVDRTQVQDGHAAGSRRAFRRGGRKATDQQTE
jgi:hypothetical protein